MAAQGPSDPRPTHLWIVWFRGGQERLDAEQHCPEGHGRRPLVLENVEADGPRHARDVRMPDFCDEPNLSNKHSILILSSKLKIRI